MAQTLNGAFSFTNGPDQDFSHTQFLKYLLRQQVPVLVDRYLPEKYLAGLRLAACPRYLQKEYFA